MLRKPAASRPAAAAAAALDRPAARPVVPAVARRPGRAARAAVTDAEYQPRPAKAAATPAPPAGQVFEVVQATTPEPNWLARSLGALRRRPVALAALAACVLAAAQCALPPPASALSLPWTKPPPPPPPPPGLVESVVGAAKAALSFVLHLDTHLGAIIAKHGAATYGLLFAIVFCETGLVLTPFLPGDSLLFAAGTFAALGSLHLPTLLAVFVSSAFLGDALNYAVGSFLGARAVEAGIVKRSAVAKTEAFYARHGGRAVVLARFVPIVRTFAPFVAGVAAMPYRDFSVYNAGGAVLWGVGLTLAGAAFGNLPFVRDNFTAVVLGIVAVSLLPLAVEVWMAKREERRGGGGGGGGGAAVRP